MLESDPASSIENHAVAQMTVLETDTGFNAWYGGYDTSETDPGPWRILYALSEDGLYWSDRQLAMDLEEVGEEAWSVREPSVTIWNEILWMAYIGMGDDGEYRLRLARCS